MSEMPRADATVIPERIRSIVYLIGTLGFPVVVAGYVLVVLSTDLRNVDKSVNALGNRIDERPMSLDRATDFIIYVTDSLGNELKTNLPELISSMELGLPKPSDDFPLKLRLNVLNRQIESYVRPVVRKHQRFASRFPSVGGNLGSLFVLSAPAETTEPGQTEAYLTGTTEKNVGESLIAIMNNNFVQFGHSEVRKYLNSQGSVPPVQQPNRSESDSDVHDDPKDQLIDPTVFEHLSRNAIDTVVMVLRDQMLTQIRQASSDLQDK